MTAPDKQQPTRPSLLPLVTEAMIKNDEFLYKKASRALDQVVKLTADAIGCTPSEIKVPEATDYYAQRAMAYFIYHVLLPFSYSTYVNLLVGNLPGCFTGLRAMLESLCKSYVADARYPTKRFFQERLRALDKSMRRRDESIAKLMRDLEGQWGLSKDISTLWKFLSEDWVHQPGLAKTMVKHLVTTDNYPSWALGILSYSQSDLVTIKKLGTSVAKFRKVLAAAMRIHRNEQPGQRPKQAHAPSRHTRSRKPNGRTKKG